jgi:hypothetical protein
MKMQSNKRITKLLMALCLLYFTNNSLAQNLSIPETIKYINNIADSDHELDFKNGTFFTKKYDWVDHRYKKRKRWETSDEIHLSNISRVSVGEPNMYSSSGSYSSVSIYCLYEDDCAKGYYAYPKYTSTPLLYWNVGNNSNAEKIANAIRYIIEKEKKSSTNNDPFSKYGKETKNYKTVNISDLYVGMSKSNVFKTLNTKPVVESIETGYEVYRVKRNNDQYFLYFTNNKLTSVDKGENIYDTIIIID